MSPSTQHASSRAFRRGERVFLSVRSGFGSRDRVHYTVVTGNPSMRLWEGIGFDGRVKEPHLLLKSEDTGDAVWEPVRAIHRAIHQPHRTKGHAARSGYVVRATRTGLFLQTLHESRKWGPRKTAHVFHSAIDADEVGKAAAGNYFGIFPR